MTRLALPLELAPSRDCLLPLLLLVVSVLDLALLTGWEAAALTFCVALSLSNSESTADPLFILAFVA